MVAIMVLSNLLETRLGFRSNDYYVLGAKEVVCMLDQNCGVDLEIAGALHFHLEHASTMFHLGEVYSFCLN